MADPLTAELTAIRDREQARDVPQLVAAVEKVLKLAGDWEDEAGKLEECAKNSSHSVLVAVWSAGAETLRESATAAREAITRELLGEAPGKDADGA